jgi:uracil-DNA glycosylase
MMNREDILRELELLPVWQLRTPKIEAPMPEVETPKQANTPVVAEPAKVFRCVVSQDAQWLFVLSPKHSAEAERLFQNMLKAVAVKVGQDIENADITALNQHSVKVMVAMGEAVSQQLLGVTTPLVALCGKQQVLNGLPVIATYAPEALLENLTEKSKAWEDLCLAKFTIANL